MSTSNDRRDPDQVAMEGNSSISSGSPEKSRDSTISPPVAPPIQVAKVISTPRYTIAQSAPDKETQKTLTVNPFSDEPAPEAVSQSNRPWQFSISFLQVIFLIVAIASAMLGLVIKANLKDSSFFYYVLLLVIAPMGMMILLGMFKGGYVLWKQWREERKAIHEMMSRGAPDQKSLREDADKF
jgi:hypothetical protein